MAIALVDGWGLKPDDHGLVHYVVPKGVRVEIGTALAFPGEHVHGRRSREYGELRTQSAVACDYCEAMRRIASGDTAS